MSQRAVMTIGHSNHSVEHFVGLLVEQGVTAVADVRSSPYSRHNPAYNREPIRESLKDAGIAYVFLGKELGARSPDPACYVDGRVQYRCLAESEVFKEGLARVIEGSRTHRLALMCAEKEPLACHRTILVARELEAKGSPVVHIHADGHLETHASALRRMRELVGVPDADLLRSQEELLDEAYALQAERIAYVMDRAPEAMEQERE